MRHHRHQNIRRSVFFHILGTLLSTGIIVIILFGIFIARFSPHPNTRPFEKNGLAYAHYIIQDLGTPPSFKKAKALSKQLFLGIRFESSDLSWSTADKLPAIDKAKKYLNRKHPGPRRYFIIPTAQGTFLFYPEFGKARNPVSPLVFILFFVILIVLFLGAWFWIQRILHPLVLLNQGVQALSQGNLDHVIPVKRQDELGRLAESFNHMTTQIREMITNKDQLLMDISHEIRSPLTRMKVALELLPSSKDKHSLEEDVIEMERMINRILEAGKLENTQLIPQKKDFSLATLIQTFIKNQQNGESRLVFKNQLGAEQIHADPEQIKTVVENILENALKYSTPKDSAIEIELTKDTTQQLILTVKDCGQGIPDEALPRIFEPFYRVDPSRAKTIEGFGLGLSICKRIVEAHDGAIVIQSQLGEGTTVRITLPIT